MYFFFQAEDGIRDGHVTGVQTCALPISWPSFEISRSEAKVLARDVLNERGIELSDDWRVTVRTSSGPPMARQFVWEQAGRETFQELQIGRASCRERVWGVGGVVRILTSRGVVIG